MATPSSFSRRPSCGACPGRPRTPTSGVRASGQGDGVTQRPPDGVVAEKPECTLVCILTRSLVTVAAAEQGGVSPGPFTVSGISDLLRSCASWASCLPGGELQLWQGVPQREPSQ